MTRGLQTLLKGVVDYAGMFPPARLPLDQAARNYAQYLQSDSAWMLGNFVVGTSQLNQLAEWLKASDNRTEPFGVAVTCGHADGADWPSVFEEQLSDVASFLQQVDGSAALRALEVRLPPATEEEMEQVFSETCGLLVDEPWAGLPVFFEVPENPSALEFRGYIAQSGGQHRDDRAFGLKLRTGGLEASTIPTIETVTEVIMLCGQHDCMWKATAGLHHPLRQFRQEVDAKMHGFLNVLTAAVLARAIGLNHVQVSEIVGDEDPANFHFDDDGIAWRDHRANIDQIEDARQRTMISFGSCDFEEPLADLAELGLR